jgi:hypothetical protein
LSKTTRSASGKSRRGRRREKHSAFFRLVEACGQPECPICHLARRRVEQYFDGLLYEKVNDPELRRRFRTAGGFCNPHSFQFMGYHDGLAGSILYRDLLGAWLDQGLDFPVQSPSGVLAGCPACAEKAKTEEAGLALLAEFLEDEQLKREVAERLAADLSACLDASNFSLGSARPSLTRQQELAWQRAVHKVAGFPAVPQKT